MLLVLLAVLALVATAYCLLDVATSRPADVRGLPKPLWFVVLLVPVAGPVAWLLAGRPETSARTRPRVLPDPAAPSSSPDDDEEFLRELRRRTEEQRRQADEQRRRDEDRPA